MLLNGRVLHCLVTDLLAKARFSSSQMESSSLVAHAKYMLSSNNTDMAFPCINLKYSYSLHRFLLPFQFFSVLWNWLLAMLSVFPSKILLVLS